MGNIPQNFTHYWIGKFPRLLSHSYHALERCSHEPSFQHYYAHDVVFSKPEYFSIPEEGTYSNNNTNSALDVNWRQTAATNGGIATVGPGGDTMNWRSTAGPVQGSPTAKKTKKGAYNFRRAGEEGVATATEGTVKKRKFYPRKD